MSSVDERLLTIEQLVRDLSAQITAGPARWLSVASAAEYSGLGQKTIRQLLAADKLTAHRPVRGRVLLDRQELDSLIATATNDVRGGRGSRRT